MDFHPLPRLVPPQHSMTSLLDAEDSSCCSYSGWEPRVEDVGRHSWWSAWGRGGVAKGNLHEKAIGLLSLPLSGGKKTKMVVGAGADVDGIEKPPSPSPGLPHFLPARLVACSHSSPHSPRSIPLFVVETSGRDAKEKESSIETYALRLPLLFVLLLLFRYPLYYSHRLSHWIIEKIHEVVDSALAGQTRAERKARQEISGLFLLLLLLLHHHHYYDWSRSRWHYFYSHGWDCCYSWG